MTFAKPDADIIVVGAGPAGMMAGGTAAIQGARVLLLERNAEPGRKLLLTGGGHGNITNTAEKEDFIRAFGKTGRFLYNTIAQFSNKDLMQFMEKRGVRLRVEEKGRVLPRNNQSSSILKALEHYMDEGQGRILRHQRVKKISSPPHPPHSCFEKRDFLGCGGLFSIETEKDKLFSSKVIIASGGKSYPQTGSSGDGYKFAAAFGHTITPLNPGLVPLESKDRFIPQLQGVCFDHIHINVFLNGKKKFSQAGEILFTHFGLSGPAVLDMSREIGELLKMGEVRICLDFAPELTMTALEQELINKFREHNQYIRNLLVGFLTPKLTPVFLALCGLSMDKRSSQITSAERKKIAALLKAFAINISNTRPLAEAMVTCGGVDTREIFPKTMESRKVKGLYFAGEVIDIDAISGGYNLQAAFSTGFVAGRAAASALFLGDVV